MRPLALIPLFLAAACVTTNNDPHKERKLDDSPWLSASPVLRQQIEDQAERLPWTHGEARIDQIQWFATVGEPAYETLLRLVEDPRPDVAGSALAALGATRDSRLVEPLRAIKWDSSRNEEVNYERGRALLRLGDWSEMPVLIDGLESDRLMVRALCVQVLHETTGERLGYDARAEPAERAKAVATWRKFWESRNVEGILTSKR